MKKLMVLLAIAACAATVWATTREWVGAANGVWSEPSNWDPAGTPAANDVLKFGDNGGYPSENDTTLAYTLWFVNTAGHPVTITGNKIFLNGTDLVDGANNKAVLSARYATDTVTIEPDVQRTGGNVNIMGTASKDFPLVFNGTVSGWSEGGGVVVFNKAVSFASPYADWYTSPFPDLYFNAKNNGISDTIHVCNGATIHFGCLNAFSISTVATLRIYAGGTVDLGGYDQGVWRLLCDSTANSARAVTSAQPALLHVYTSQNLGALAVGFEGGAGFDLNASSKSITCSLARESSTTGTLSVATGDLTLNAKWASARSVVIGAAGKLTVATAAALGRKADVRVTEGGILNISENCDCTIQNLVLPGVGEVWPGEWGSSESGAENQSSALQGKGKVFVTGAKKSGVWTGADASDSLSAAGNWKINDEVPQRVDVMSGSLFAAFGESGAQATVDCAAKLDGIELTLPSFTFLKSGAGSLGIGEKGLRTVESDSANSYVFKPEVIAFADQTWTVERGNAVVLDGGLGGSANVAASGDGTIELNASGAETAALSYTGKGRVMANCDVISNSLTLAGVDSYDPLVVRGNGKTVFCGKITYASAKATLIQPSGSTVIEYAGGFLGAASFNPKDTSRIVFSGKPAIFNATTFFDSGYVNGVEFAVANNETTGSNVFYLYNGVGEGKTLSCSVPWALNYAFNLTLGCPWSGGIVNYATLDISGGDQGLRLLTTRKPDSGYELSVFSSGDNVLHVRNFLDNNSRWNTYATFKGGAGVSCETDDAILNTIDSVNTSTGRVCVAGGTLTFAAGATWENASKICVSGGKLVLPRKGIVTNRDLQVELTGGVLQLADGLTLHAKSVSIGGVPCSPGTVGKIGSGATHETAMIEGNGVIRIKGGFVAIIR